MQTNFWLSISALTIGRNAVLWETFFFSVKAAHCNFDEFFKQFGTQISANHCSGAGWYIIH